MKSDEGLRLVAAKVEVAAAIVWRGDRLLLQQRGPGQAMAGCWECPGGKVKAYETLEQACRRELLEETGITACELELLKKERFTSAEILEQQVTFDDETLEITWFVVTRWFGDLMLRAPATGLGWFPLDTLDRPHCPINVGLRRIRHLLEARRG